MALFLAKHISLFILFFLAIQIHARENVFFSKVSRPTETPLDQDHQAAPQKEQPHHELPRQSHNGYGLYGRHGPEQYSSFSPPATTTSTNGFPSSFPNIPQQYKYSSSDSIPSTDSNEYEMEEWKSNYVDDPNKRYYGMSDTRFLENGKYYYDVNGDRDRSGSHTKSGRRSYNNNGYYKQNNDAMDENRNNKKYQEETKEEYIP